MITIESAGSGPAAITIPDDTARVQVQGCYDAPFLQRLYVIVSAVAQAILQESGTTTLHVQRASYARQVASDPTTIVNRSIVFAVVADGMTNPLSTDQQIANRLGDIWNNLSTGYS